MIRLINVSPCYASGCAGNTGYGDHEIFRDWSKGFSGSTPLTDQYHVLRRELRGRLRKRTSWMLSKSVIPRLLKILGIIAIEQVRRINAGLYVAKVQYQRAIWDRTILDLERQTMCPDQPFPTATPLQHSVTRGGHRTEPEPAFVRTPYVHLFPKPCFQ